MPGGCGGQGVAGRNGWLNTAWPALRGAAIYLLPEGLSVLGKLPSHNPLRPKPSLQRLPQKATLTARLIFASPATPRGPGAAALSPSYLH